MNRVDYITIEPDKDGGFWVVQHGVYSESSVLAGQDFRQLTRHFDTLEETQAAFPQAEALDYSTKNTWAGQSLPDVAPAWFDPANAGEVWREEDY